MGVGEDHSELVADGDAVHHVPDDALDSAEDGVSFFLLQPHSELDSIFLILQLLFSHLEWDVLEGLGELPQWTLHVHNPRLYVDLHPVRYLQLLLRHYVLHRPMDINIIIKYSIIFKYIICPSHPLHPPLLNALPHTHGQACIA